MNEIIEQRRVSSHFIPIAKPRKRGGQLAFDTEWTQDRVEENVFINRLTVLLAHMNPDLAMGDELLKKIGQPVGVGAGLASALVAVQRQPGTGQPETGQPQARSVPLRRRCSTRISPARISSMGTRY